MEQYNYREVMKGDIRDYIGYNADLSEYETMEDAFEALHDEMWIADEVTGNGTGCYSNSSTWDIEEHLCHNISLLGEALSEFGYGADYLVDKSVREWDVTIRCYLLSDVLQTVLEEMNDEFNIWEE